MPLAKGTKVKQIVSVINGVVSDAKYDADKCAFTYHVEYIDDTGEPASRWFDENQVAAVDENQMEAA